MFITKPIKEFSIDNNVLKINEKEFRFSGMENLDNEILESLISKGAYASTMLYLNKNCLLESVNNKKITSRQYRSYLRECKKLLKENVYEATEGNFKPLGNINGLELLENDEHIARGKHKLMIEDFRTLKEQDIIIPSNSEDGWGEDVDDLTYDFFDQVDRISYEIKNARRGSYAGIGTDIDSLANAFDEIANMASEISSTLANAEVNYSSDETEYDDGDTNWAAEEEADATERMEKRYGGIEESVKPQQSEDVVEEFQHSEKTYDDFMKALNKISALEDSNEITREQYEDCINVIIADFKSRHENVNEECEGTQCSDIAEKKDQELGLVKPEDPNKLIVKESNLFNVDYNHGFKGFILDENGRFVRGKYVLINENGKIKAVKKSMLEQYMSEAQDKYGNNILDRDSAEALMQKVVDELNKAFTYEYEGETLKPYDFKYRFQDEDICLFDANEEFTYEDKNYEKVEEIVKKTMSMPNIYLEPETNVTMIIAGCYLK